MSERRAEKEWTSELVIHVSVDRFTPEIEIVTTVSIFLFAITVIAALVCAGLAALGLWLTIPHGDVRADSTIDFFHLMKVSTSDVGIGLVALGIGGFIFTVARVLRTLRALFGRV